MKLSSRSSKVRWPGGVFQFSKKISWYIESFQLVQRCLWCLTSSYPCKALFQVLACLNNQDHWVLPGPSLLGIVPLSDSSNQQTTQICWTSPKRTTKQSFWQHSFHNNRFLHPTALLKTNMLWKSCKVPYMYENSSMRRTLYMFTKPLSGSSPTRIRT